MSETAWAHLPNAAAVDEILADVRTRLKVWRRVSDTVWGDAWGVASETAWESAKRTIVCTARSAVWDELWETMWDAAKGTTRSTAWIAISALVAWDSSAALLALTPDALRTIIDTCDGDVKHQAVLLLPAVIARSTP